MRRAATSSRRPPTRERRDASRSSRSPSWRRSPSASGRSPIAGRARASPTTTQPSARATLRHRVARAPRDDQHDEAADDDMPPPTTTSNDNDRADHRAPRESSVLPGSPAPLAAAVSPASCTERSTRPALGAPRPRRSEDDLPDRRRSPRSARRPLHRRQRRRPDQTHRHHDRSRLGRRRHRPQSARRSRQRRRRSATAVHLGPVDTLAVDSQSNVYLTDATWRKCARSMAGRARSPPLPQLRSATLTRLDGDALFVDPGDNLYIATGAVVKRRDHASGQRRHHRRQRRPRPQCASPSTGRERPGSPPATRSSASTARHTPSPARRRLRQRTRPLRRRRTRNPSSTRQPCRACRRARWPHLDR